MREWLFVFLLLALAFLLFWISILEHKKSRLPKGKIIYADTDQWQTLPAPLYDPQLNLAGKPDYVVIMEKGLRIPVEVKSMPAPNEPYFSHIMQLAAYCWLVEHTSSQRPPYGLLHYRDKTIQIDYSTELEGQLIELTGHIRQAEALPEGSARSHQEAARCLRCGYRESCDQRL